uniref:hypothetical protein n=1 Tax=Alistipes sp. TaxID=1872444 RepID=UPI004057B9E1
MDDTRFNIDLKIGSRSVFGGIKIEGHGGSGELKRVSIENLRLLRDRITQLLEDFDREGQERINLKKH